MINVLLIIIAGIFALSSIFDIKYKSIPSVILTSGLFIVIALRPENLIFGILAYVFAMLIRDLIHTVGMDFGIADMKAFAIMGFLISNMNDFTLMIMIFLVFQFIYTVAWRFFINKQGEMAFIPCLSIVYTAMIYLGGVK